MLEELHSQQVALFSEAFFSEDEQEIADRQRVYSAKRTNNDAADESTNDLQGRRESKTSVPRQGKRLSSRSGSTDDRKEGRNSRRTSNEMNEPKPYSSLRSPARLKAVLLVDLPV